MGTKNKNRRRQRSSRRRAIHWRARVGNGLRRGLACLREAAGKAWQAVQNRLPGSSGKASRGRSAASQTRAGKPAGGRVGRLWKNRRVRLISGATVLAAGIGGAVFFLSHYQRLDLPDPGPATPEAIWVAIQEEAGRHGLDPDFVWAIVFAESSLDPKASSSVARGLMQLTEPAWQDVSDLPYEAAWNWRENITAGSAYLGQCKRLLVKEGQFSYARLAASYRFGYYRLKGEGFNLANLPAPRNRIYQQLFAGEIAPAPRP